MHPAGQATQTQKSPCQNERNKRKTDKRELQQNSEVRVGLFNTNPILHRNTQYLKMFSEASLLRGEYAHHILVRSKKPKNKH
jgi:hypothetical protein